TTPIINQQSTITNRCTHALRQVVLTCLTHPPGRWPWRRGLFLKRVQKESPVAAGDRTVFSLLPDPRGGHAAALAFRLPDRSTPLRRFPHTRDRGPHRQRFRQPS